MTHSLEDSYQPTSCLHSELQKEELREDTVSSNCVSCRSYRRWPFWSSYIYSFINIYGQQVGLYSSKLDPL